MRCQHVHLSPDQATTLTVGSRHGTPVIFAVDAAAMHAEDVPSTPSRPTQVVR
jgi:RNA:NAD 2'-phosphotransferase (TPT1/KptA family)